MHSGIRVLICDDHPLYRKGLADAIRSRIDLHLVGEAATGDAALEQIRALRPDVVVLDMKMQGLGGMDVMRAVARDQLECRVLFLSGYSQGSVIYEAVQAGAGGYLSKDCTADRICDAITHVASGRAVLAQDAQDAIRDEIRVRAPAGPRALSEREREILTLTAEGLSASDIGRRLFLSAATVKTHLQRTYQKLEVSNRAAAVAEAMRRGLLE